MVLVEVSIWVHIFWILVLGILAYAVCIWRRKMANGIIALFIVGAIVSVAIIATNFSVDVPFFGIVDFVERIRYVDIFVIPAGPAVGVVVAILHGLKIK
jgi:hypothetical protein